MTLNKCVIAAKIICAMMVKVKRCRRSAPHNLPRTPTVEVMLTNACMSRIAAVSLSILNMFWTVPFMDDDCYGNDAN
jgi:hypothetical protein